MLRNHVLASCLFASLLSCTGSTPRTTSASIEMFDGSRLGSWSISEFGGQGEVYAENGKIWLEAGNPLTGVHWTGEFPQQDYELSFDAQRIDGSDFFCGLTFPVGKDALTLVLGGWGGSLVGISCLDGKDASTNPTMRTIHFEDHKSYHIVLRVSPARVRASLDGTTIVDFDPRAYRLSLRPEVAPSMPLGIATFATTATIENLTWRRLPRTG